MGVPDSQPPAPSPQVWRWVEGGLWAALLLAGGLNMLRVRGGLLTSHLADAAIPALLFVVFSGLSGRPRPRLLPQALRDAPGLLAVVIFAANAATEVSQYFWPKGLFPGTFDPLDFVAFGAGILPFYLIEARRRRRQGAS